LTASFSPEEKDSNLLLDPSYFSSSSIIPDDGRLLLHPVSLAYS